MVKIEIVSALPFEGFVALRAESEKEGYRFLKRLEMDWGAHKNRFSLPGEGLYKVLAHAELIGIGGINQCPYKHTEGIGRIRRFYIKSSWRSQGIGKKLLAHLIAEKGAAFAEINLSTDSEAAARFYERNGFARIHDEAKVSHRLIHP
ncbi:MAG: GNAT family N-acetyltransferase [Bacteroidia bacterium]